MHLSITAPTTRTTMPSRRSAAVFGVSSIEMLAVVSSKRTPLTITLPLAITPIETALVGVSPPDPVPPVPPPQPEIVNAAAAARNANFRVFMMVGPLVSLKL
jgi:hypothetical protein